MTLNFNKTFLKFTFKQEILQYSLPIPVLIAFSVYGTKFMQKAGTLFLILVVFSSFITLISHIIIKYIYAKPIFEAIKKIENSENDEQLFKKAKIVANRLPFFDAIYVLIRWVVITNSITPIPLLLLGYFDFTDVLGMFLIMSFTGFIIAPIFYLSCENAMAKFLSIPQISNIKFKNNLLSLNITTKIQITSFFSITYLLGILLTLLYFLSIGYLTYQNIKYPIFLLGLTMTILTIASLNYLTKNISDILIQTDHIIEKIKVGNFSNRLLRENSDELGRIAEAFNTMLDYLTDILFKIKDSAYFMQQSVTSISALSQETSAISEEITSTVNTIKDNAKDITGFVQNTYNKSVDILSHTRKLQSNSDVLNTNINKIYQTLFEGKKTFQNATNIINKTVENSNATYNSINILFERAKNINQVLDSIKDISVQTNLLSLNSAIEAARAGEAGRGFSVVAHQIGKLAQRTQDDTQKIESILKSIYDETENSMAAINLTVENINDTNEEIIEVSDQFSTITYDIENMVKLVNNMHQSFNSQELSVEDMSKSMEQAAILVKKISSQISDIFISINEENKSTQDVVHSIENLNFKFTSLNDFVSKFKM